jgi:hypothetical protein
VIVSRLAGCIVFTHCMFPTKVLLGNTVEVCKAAVVPVARLVDIVVWTMDSALSGRQRVGLVLVHCTALHFGSVDVALTDVCV